MRTAWYKSIIYGLALLAGIACLGLAYHQYQYIQLITAGNRAVTENRFDTQAYDQASRFWLASEDLLHFNQGLLAYKAQHFPRAATYFRQVSQRTDRPELRTKTLYNLGIVMLELQEAEAAAELFKEALRLDPQDQEAKFNLERLYQWILRQEGQQREASLPQAPGLGQEQQGKGRQNDGAGRSTPRADI
jgi:Ca-activated chloride channel family protein